MSVKIPLPHQDLQPFHHVAMSHYLTPHMVFSGKLNKSACFLSCNNIVWANIFNRIQSMVPLDVFQEAIRNDLSRLDISHSHRLSDVLKGLIRTGYIPSPCSNSDDFHIYEGDSSSHWIHTPFLPSSQLMRHYWIHIMNIKGDIRRGHHLYTILQCIVLCLPGTHKRCSDCRWYVPECEMHNDCTCMFCVDRSCKQIIKKTSKSSRIKPRSSTFYLHTRVRKYCPNIHILNRKHTHR